MLIEQKIERARLSQSQQLIADYILEKRSNINDMTINGNDYQISQKIGISWL